jgi:hypothetical protein
MTTTTPSPAPAAPTITFCRRAGGSWITSRTVPTPVGEVEEITLQTTPPSGARSQP